jgi:hypothetical protein
VIVRALNRAIDSIETLEEAQVGTSFLDRLEQLGGSFQDLQLEPISRLPQSVFCPLPLVYQTRVLKGSRGVIRRYGNEELVNLGGKVGATAGGGNQSPFPTDADRNEHTVTPLRILVVVGNDLLAQKVARGEPAVQPVRECRRRPSSCHFDGGATIRIAQSNENEIQLQRSHEDVGETGGNARRISPDPCRWNR